MKKLFTIAALLGLTGFGSTLKAQDEKDKVKDKNKESQEIIIRSNGDKEKKITVEIDGDKVTINGKPMSEFKDDNVTINKRNIIVRDRNGMRTMTIPGDDFMNNFRVFNDREAESRAFLGVSTEDNDDGAKISSVTKESAAAKAGLKEGDVITKVGDKKVDGPESLLQAVSSMKPKDEVKVYYKRDGKEKETKAVLGERKGAGSMSYSFSGPDGLARTYTVPGVKIAPRVPAWDEKSFEGFSMAPGAFNNNDNQFEVFDQFMARQQRLGLKIQDTEEGNGVKVLDVDKDSPADKSGLKKDDVVTEIGGKKVSNTYEAREQLQMNKEKSAYAVKAKRNGSEMNFDIKIPKRLKTANL